MSDEQRYPVSRRGPSADQAPLQASLENLQAALDEQRRALRDWRFAMAELGISVAGLGTALNGYQATLGGVEGKLEELRTTAGKLAGWADGGPDENAEKSAKSSASH